MKRIKHYKATIFYNQLLEDEEIGRYIEDVYKIDLNNFYSNDPEEIEAFIRRDLYGIPKAHFGDQCRFRHFIIKEVDASEYER